jgi:hypothetical protein
VIAAAATARFRLVSPISRLTWHAATRTGDASPGPSTLSP